jgi:hypothetical protein
VLSTCTKREEVSQNIHLHPEKVQLIGNLTKVILVQPYCIPRFQTIPKGIFSYTLIFGLRDQAQWILQSCTKRISNVQVKVRPCYCMVLATPQHNNNCTIRRCQNRLLVTPGHNRSSRDLPRYECRKGSCCWLSSFLLLYRSFSPLRIHNPPRYFNHSSLLHSLSPQKIPNLLYNTTGDVSDADPSSKTY